jgi:very-short-patch-repair endonuclease
MNPKLASEWHHSKNGYLTPGDVTPGSSKRVWWQCKRNHEWKGSIGNRTRRYGCPYCYFQISSVELRIFTELASIFEDIKQKVKISGAECDIYIPSLKLGIEYDGEYWHRNKNKKDLGKNSLFKKSGVALIRIREVPLPKITQEDIQFNYSKDDKLSLVKDILKKIQKASPLEKKISEKINFYFQKTSFANDKYFQELEELLPSPPAEKSLAFLNPKVAGEWHPTKNGKLRPEDVTPGSGKKVWWQCRKGHACNASPAQRTKGKGCPYCINRKVCNDNCLSTVNPLIASEWHPTKNGKLRPEDVLPFSNTKVWWQCKKGHEWHVAPNGRSRGNNCPNCYHRRRLGGTVSGKQLSFFD